MTQKRSTEFLEFWNQAKAAEEKGHEFFQQGKYQKAAEQHMRAAELFSRVLRFIQVDDEEDLRSRSLVNYHIELANYQHCLASLNFYSGEKEEALDHFQKATEEQKKSIQEIESLKEGEKNKLEILTLKATLHLFLTYENLTSAQISFLGENYLAALEQFKIAEIHTTLEMEFLMEINDLQRLKRTKARLFYLKGQISRSTALLAMQKTDRRKAKEEYMKASSNFEEATKLYPEWEEYKTLAVKMKKMALVIKK